MIPGLSCEFGLTYIVYAAINTWGTSGIRYCTEWWRISGEFNFRVLLQVVHCITSYSIWLFVLDVHIFISVVFSRTLWSFSISIFRNNQSYEYTKYIRGLSVLWDLFGKASAEEPREKGDSFHKKQTPLSQDGCPYKWWVYNQRQMLSLSPSHK